MRVARWATRRPMAPLLFVLRASGEYRHAATPGIMASMEQIRIPGRQKSQLDDLESTRVDLIGIYTDLLRRLDDARSAQWQAATSGLGFESAIHIGDGAPPLSPAQLASAISQYESEVAHVRRIIDRVEARLAVLPAAAAPRR